MSFPSSGATRRYSFQFAAVPAFLLADVESGRLKRGDIAIVSRLIRLARDGRVERMTDGDLAEACGVSESTWKASLARLRAAGRVVVQRVKAWWRRALVLAWLAPAPEVNSPAPRGSENRPPADTPPAPPSCEGPKEDDGQDPGESSSLSAPGPDPATAEVLEQARGVFGEQLPAAKVETVVETFGAEKAKAAVAWAKKASARSWGYVVNALVRGEREGGIEAPAPAKSAPAGPPPAAEVRASREPEAPTTGEDLEQLRRWATGESGPVLQRMASGILNRRGQL